LLADDQDFDTIPHFGRVKAARAEAAPQAAPPPIPPAPLTPVIAPRDTAARLPQRPARRAEPRLD
jgi:hypothetical protein